MSVELRYKQPPTSTAHHHDNNQGLVASHVAHKLSPTAERRELSESSDYSTTMIAPPLQFPDAWFSPQAMEMSSTGFDNSDSQMAVTPTNSWIPPPNNYPSLPSDAPWTPYLESNLVKTPRFLFRLTPNAYYERLEPSYRVPSSCYRGGLIGSQDLDYKGDEVLWLCFACYHLPCASCGNNMATRDLPNLPPKYYLPEHGPGLDSLASNLKAQYSEMI